MTEPGIDVGAGLVLRCTARADTSWRGTLEVAGPAVCEGHFPAAPIVPAVAVLAAVEAGVRAWRGRAVAAWAAIRFRAPLTPGARCDLEFGVRPSGDLEFRVATSEGPVASGRLTEAPA